MTLYHGSLEVVEKPAILEPSHTMDYGKGFYTTTSKEQADKWVVRKINATNQSKGYTNFYSFEETSLSFLKVLRFENPDEVWLDFVMENRMNKGFSHDYDIVYGPVANDRVYAAFALYEEGMLDKHGIIRELRAFKLANQILFHTPRALEFLQFEKSEEISK
ncbi:MAG: DUF3990 domain-containing protein [Treponema sp.]|nr:DUF3990 domain-containing protein [Treponema sp.]